MLREIVTKAVVSKGKIVDSNEIRLPIVENASKVVGCWIINHHYLSLVENDKVYANGTYDIHIWYSLNDNSDTNVFKQTIEYRQEFNMDNNNFNKESSEYKVYCIEYPSCSNIVINDNNFVVTVKKGLAVDVIGESKLLVQVSESTSREDDFAINTNYINK